MILDYQSQAKTISLSVNLITKKFIELKLVIYRIKTIAKIIPVFNSFLPALK